MDWLKIGSVILMVTMLVIIWPAAKHWLKHSPKGSSRDWIGEVIPLVLVIGFVFLLVKLV